MYAFQNPVIPTEPLQVTVVGGVRSFLSNLPPVLANDGFNMYWAVVRSELRCWAGEANLGRRDFGEGSLNAARFTRGNPSSIAPKAPPVTSSGDTLFAYGPSAANEIYRVDEECTDAGTSVFTFPDPTTVVTNKVLLSTNDLFLYVSTPKGELHFFDTTNLANGPLWTVPLNGGIVGEMAMSLDGSLIYTADVGGIVRATKVGEPVAIASPAPVTMAPVDEAVDSPTMSPVFIGIVDPPTMAPIVGVEPSASPAPTSGPTTTSEPSYSVMPVGVETDSPVFEAGPEPVPQPVPRPVQQPSAFTTPAPVSAASSVVLTSGAVVLATVSMMLV